MVRWEVWIDEHEHEKARVATGETVTWTPTHGYRPFRRTGVVLGFVPALEDALACLPKHVLRSHRKFDYPQSAFDRYVIEVTRPNGTKDYYAPQAGVIERAVAESGA